MMLKLTMMLVFTLFGNACTGAQVLPVKTGIDVLQASRFQQLQGKNIGLITNQTGVNAELNSTIDIFYQTDVLQLKALFAPEHGIRGNIFAGKKIKSSTDSKTGLPVYSLYGRTKKPTPDMLRGIDALVYDIQDTGARTYTFIYTMALAMEAAAENKIQFFVLDRPNPVGADRVEGPVLDPAFASFIGKYPIPYLYGMTAGELAKYINTEFKIGARLSVIPMRGYRRKMIYADTGLEWIGTSAHIPHATTAFYYPATGIMGELQQVSEGVGYTLPFEVVCQSWIDRQQLADELNGRKLSGVRFRPCSIKPYYFTFKGVELHGVQLHITDFRAFKPVETQIHILDALLKLYPDAGLFKTQRIASFDRAMGTDEVRKMLLNREDVKNIFASWKAGLKAYAKTRLKYLIYD